MQDRWKRKNHIEPQINESQNVLTDLNLCGLLGKGYFLTLTFFFPKNSPPYKENIWLRTWTRNSQWEILATDQLEYKEVIDVVTNSDLTFFSAKISRSKHSRSIYVSLNRCRFLLTAIPLVRSVVTIIVLVATLSNRNTLGMIKTGELWVRTRKTYKGNI